MVSFHKNATNSWKVRFGKPHQIIGDKYTGILTVEDLGGSHAYISGMVNMPTREEIKEILKELQNMGYIKVKWERLVGNEFVIHSVDL